MRISNARDLKLAYEQLLMIAELVDITKVDFPEMLQDRVKDIKTSIRRYNKRTNDRKLVKDYGIDGYIELVELPQYIKTKEAGNEYFVKSELLYVPNSAYDCTGAPFTSWFKVFPRRGRMMAYHRVSIDC